MGDKKFNILSLASVGVSALGLFFAKVRILFGIVGVVLGVLGVLNFDEETERFKEIAYAGVIIGLADVLLQIVKTVFQFLNR